MERWIDRPDGSDAAAPDGGACDEMAPVRAASDYRAFLLRCWTDGGRRESGEPTWRFSAEEPRTGERRGFADLAALLTFLRAELPGSDGEPGA